MLQTPALQLVDFHGVLLYYAQEHFVFSLCDDVIVGNRGTRAMDVELSRKCNWGLPWAQNC
jgi:hypothetical protein